MSSRCPTCGSGNIVGYMREWECIDCGYKFKLSTSHSISKKVSSREDSGEKVGNDRCDLTSFTMVIDTSNSAFSL